MPSSCWKLSACISTLVASTVLAAAQSAPGEPRVADDATIAALQQAPHVPQTETARRTIDAATARRLWDDPKIKNFIGLSENAYNFTDPNEAPGFGTLTTTEASR